MKFSSPQPHTDNSDRAFNTSDLGVDQVLDFVRSSDRIALAQTTFGNTTPAKLRSLITMF